MEAERITGVPSFLVEQFGPLKSDYCLCIPVINEKDRLEPFLKRAMEQRVGRLTDIIICDGGSTDGSTEPGRLKSLGVNTLLTLGEKGRQGTQLRMGFWWALRRGYRGIITVDGNNKDSIESVSLFIDKLNSGFDFVQGSRWLPGGHEENTPLLRHLAARYIHAPLISRAAGFEYSDTTNAFRGYSKKYLEHPGVGLFREIFTGYELLAYLSVRAPQLGLNVCEVPVSRVYPGMGKTPTKISAVQGNLNLLGILIKTVRGDYNL